MVEGGKFSSNQTILQTKSYTFDEVILLQTFFSLYIVSIYREKKVQVLKNNFKLHSFVYEKTIGQWIIGR